MRKSQTAFFLTTYERKHTSSTKKEYKNTSLNQKAAIVRSPKKNSPAHSHHVAEYVPDPVGRKERILSELHVQGEARASKQAICMASGARHHLSRSFQ